MTNYQRWVIRDWFVKKIDFPPGVMSSRWVEGIVDETEKAYKVVIATETADGERDVRLERWVPKACLETEEEYRIREAEEADAEARAKSAADEAGRVLDAIGKRWVARNGAVRWYVNDWHAIAGIEASYYKTGNVSSVSIEGYTSVSNTWFTKNLMSAKVWVDQDCKVHCDYFGSDARDIADRVRDRLEAMIAEAREGQ